MLKEIGAGKGNLEDANVDDWAATVEKLKAQYPDTKIVIPGHGKSGGTEKQILKMKNVSTSTFALGVAEEFILFVAITYFSLLTDNYGWWLGLLVAFTLHIFLHITQFIVVKRYVPAITTSILVLPYCLFTLVKFINMNILFGYLPDTGPIA